MSLLDYIPKKRDYSKRTWQGGTVAPGAPGAPGAPATPVAQPQAAPPAVQPNQTLIGAALAARQQAAQAAAPGAAPAPTRTAPAAPINFNATNNLNPMANRLGGPTSFNAAAPAPAQPAAATPAAPPATAPVAPAPPVASPATPAANPNQQAQQNASLLGALMQLAMPHLRNALGPRGPQDVPTPGLFARETDAIRARSQAAQLESQRLGAAASAQHFDMDMKRGPEHTNDKMRFLIEGRSPEGVKMHAGDPNPLMSGQQMRDAGLKGNWSGSIVPEGYTRGNDGQMRRIPYGEDGSTIQPISEGDMAKANNVLKTAEAASDAAGKPKYANAKDYQERSSVFKAAMARKIAGEADGTYRTAGQRDDETPEQFAARKADIANAKMARTPSGKIVNDAGTVAGQAYERAQTETQAASVAPTPREEAETAYKNALTEKHLRDANRPGADPRIDALYGKQIDNITATINNYRKRETEAFRPPTGLSKEEVDALAKDHADKAADAKAQAERLEKQRDGLVGKWAGEYGMNVNAYTPPAEAQAFEHPNGKTYYKLADGVVVDADGKPVKIKG